MPRPSKRTVKIPGKVITAGSWPARARGLMFRSRQDFTLVLELPFESRFNSAIHSMFVFFEFDAVFCNKQKKVVDVRARVKPFSFFIASRAPAKYVVELPARTAEKLKIKIGDKLGF